MRVSPLLGVFLLLPIAPLAAAAEAPFSRTQQLAAEVAQVLCDTDRYLSCTAESQDRCKLELGMVAGRCAQSSQRPALAATEMTSDLTQCILSEHATLIGFDAEGLIACLAEPR
ncbi:MAG: hypothetical protein AAGG11_07220 [Pseudomonadota bacterium]